MKIRRLTTARIYLISLAVLSLPGIFLADRVLSRADRIEFSLLVNDLVSVRDALLRYEFEKGVLPESMQALVPKYLRSDQIKSDVPLYDYDRDQRTIGMAEEAVIKGIFTRKWPPKIFVLPELEELRVSPEPADLAVELLVPKGPEFEDPPKGALVLEAELYSETNYGWEVRQDPTCSGGAYIHSKEGIANGPGQTHCRIFNFYDIKEGTEYTYLKHHFNLPEDGTYYIYGRMWTTGSHCSNCIIVGVDRGGPRNGRGYHGSSMRNATPFRWVWTQAGKRPVHLKAGEHYLHSYLHEDGIRLDQFILSPVPIYGGGAYKVNLLTNNETSFQRKAGPPVDLTFDLKSMVVTSKLKPDCRLAIRKLRSSEGTAAVRIVILKAGTNGSDLDVGRYDINLSDLHELSFLPLDFEQLDIENLPRREYLLRAELTRNGEILAECQVPLMHPFSWEVYGPLQYLRNYQPGPLDAGAELKDDAGVKWTRFADSSWNHFGVMDFGLQASGNSLHAPVNVTIYARTNIVVPETGVYLLKIQSDDQMLLWIDGKEVYRHNAQAPVTRSVKRLKLHLERGTRRVRIRVNNRGFSEYGDGRWQASLRFRTKDDLLSDIRGIP